MCRQCLRARLIRRVLVHDPDPPPKVPPAIRSRVSHAAFPWQLATLAGVGRLMPDALYDRTLKKQRSDKRKE